MNNSATKWQEDVLVILKRTAAVYPVVQPTLALYERMIGGDMPTAMEWMSVSDTVSNDGDDDELECASLVAEYACGAALSAAANDAGKLPISYYTEWVFAYAAAVQ